MPRIPFIAGNWKMNTTPSEGVKLATEVLAVLSRTPNPDPRSPIQVAVCPPFTALSAVAAVIKNTNVSLGAQNFHVAEKDGKLLTTGAYTGEVGPAMLKEAGVVWVILGHSERRQYFGETDAGVNRKIRACFAVGLLPIVCVGETLEEREAGSTEKVVETQVRGSFANIPAAHAAQCVIAYEPVWAIGTGRTATPAQAQEVHAFIRNLLGQLYDAATAQAIRIQYGGSMNAANARELLAQPDIDGGLIGGASLKAADFAAIVRSSG